MKTISRYIMTLALLLTAVTGAWAQTETLLTTITSTAPNNTFTSGSKTFDDIATVTFSGEVYNNNDARGWFRGSNDVTLTVAAASDAYTITRVKFFNDYNYTSAFDEEAPFEAALKDRSAVVNGTDLGRGGVTKIEVYGTAEPPIEVTPVAEPAANTKQWTFSMPGSDVVLTPIYAKAAAFATTGTEPDVKTLLPEAAEGVIAGTDASLIAEGTGIVAFAGESTDVTQGTLMYAIGTSATEAPALTAFSATVPTAENVADDGADVYVWYYIQGADTPDGQEATEENTFNDTEICTTPLTVTVLTNKFDITLKAANANTIEAGKATVTVAGAAATVTDGKLQGVKMGSEVKLEAKPGYKFRKVEVKKGAAGPVADIVWDVTNVSDLHVEGDYLSYTKEGVKLSGNADQVQAEWNNSAYLGTPGMEFITMESGGFTFTAPTGKAFTKIEMKAQGSSGWGSANLGTGWAYNTGTVTWTGSAASTVKLLKDADMFSGDFISSIAFYLSE